MALLHIGDPAPDAELQNAAGETVSLSNLWASGPVLLTFLRHFGCTFCREALGTLERAAPKLKAAKLHPVVIAQGQPKHAERYGIRLAPSLTSLVRDNTDVYASYGLERANLSQLASLEVLRGGARAFSQGYIGGPIVGDPTMMPGTFIVDGNGVLRFAYYSRNISDHPRIESLIAEAHKLQEAV